MLSCESKLKILSEIAEELNKNHIKWALGASGLLYLKGIVDDFNDLDIFAVEDDVPKVVERFDSMGSKLSVS